MAMILHPKLMGKGGDGGEEGGGDMVGKSFPSFNMGYIRSLMAIDRLQSTQLSFLAPQQL